MTPERLQEMRDQIKGLARNSRALFRVGDVVDLIDELDGIRVAYAKLDQEAERLRGYLMGAEP